MEETLLSPDPPETQTLELDELWSFVQRRENKVWIWIALCRATRQIVAFALGDRSETTCRKLWEAIPVAYKQGHCYSDFWDAYANVVPAEQHTPVTLRSGETARVERRHE